MIPVRPGYFAASDGFTRSYQRKYVSLFSKDHQVLDLGCGSGVFLDLLREAGIPALGVDHDGEALEQCRARGLHVEGTDLLSFVNTSTASFGGAFCSHVIEHLPVPEAERLLHHLHRILIPDSPLVIITPDPNDLLVLGEYFWLDPTHVRPYPRRLVAHLLEGHGFTIVHEGNDPDTRLRMPRRHPGAALRHVLSKLRFGSRYGCGDSAVVARRLP